MSDIVTLTANIVQTSTIPNLAPFKYTSSPATTTNAIGYQVFDTSVVAGIPLQVTPSFRTLITNFLYFNLDLVNPVTINMIPNGAAQHPYNAFVVAPGGWIGGSIAIAAGQIILLQGNTATPSLGLLYFSGY